MTLSPELLAIIAGVKPASDEEIVTICGAYMTQMEAMLISRIVAEGKVVKPYKDALKNLMGIYDTPLSRRRFPQDDFMKEAIGDARDLIALSALEERKVVIAECIQALETNWTHKDPVMCLRAVAALEGRTS